MLYEDLISIIKEQTGIEDTVIRLENRCLNEVQRECQPTAKAFEIKQLLLRVNNTWNLVRTKEARWLQQDYPLELFKDMLPADLYNKIMKSKSS